MTDFFPITDIVDAALAGTGTRVSFSPVANGSDAYRSSIFVASDELQQKIEEALKPYGITLTVFHDQTHKRIRRIGLAIPAEQMKAAAELYNEQTLAYLKELTGADWRHDAGKRAYVSDPMDQSKAEKLRDQMNSRNLETPVAHGTLEKQVTVEVSQYAIGFLRAHRSKAEQVGTADTRQGMVRS